MAPLSANIDVALWGHVPLDATGQAYVGEDFRPISSQGCGMKGALAIFTRFPEVTSVPRAPTATECDCRKGMDGSLGQVSAKRLRDPYAAKMVCPLLAVSALIAVQCHGI
nr:hypothetical protein Iba_chr08cCG14210 [Ipomoea batatas]